MQWTRVNTTGEALCTDPTGTILLSKERRTLFLIYLAWILLLQSCYRWRVQKLRRTKKQGRSEGKGSKGGGKNLPTFKEGSLKLILPVGKVNLYLRLYWNQEFCLIPRVEVLLLQNCTEVHWGSLFHQPSILSSAKCFWVFQKCSSFTIEIAKTTIIEDINPIKYSKELQSTNLKNLQNDPCWTFTQGRLTCRIVTENVWRTDEEIKLKKSKKSF